MTYSPAIQAISIAPALPKDITAANVLTVTHLTQQVGDGEQSLTILRDLHLEVCQGESVAIVGSSGSGKSTLLGLLAGLDVPTHGEIRVRNQAFSRLDEDGRAAVRAQSMGFVFQSFQLLPSMTVLENVMLPLQLAQQPEAHARALATIAQVGLADRLQHYPKQLSGGEQQRVAIARAFAPHPAILLADEPTGNLDAATGARIIDLLFSLNQAMGTTLILVTHDATLAKRCARVLTLIDGQLSATCD